MVKRARQFDGDLIASDCLHVTLFFLDGGSDSRDHIFRMACEAALEVRMPSFDVSFDRVASFRGKPGRHPFVLLGDDGLNRLKLLQRMLGAAMARNSLKHLVKADFNPHVTLLYDKRQVEAQPIEPTFWTVGEFVLIHSMGGHTHLARWRLRVE